MPASKHYISDPKFWRARLDKAIKDGRPYQAVTHTSKADWDAKLETHRPILRAVLDKLRFAASRPLCLLDAGCGIGSLVGSLPADIPVEYLGFDIFDGFIEIAQRDYPNRRFEIASVFDLPYDDHSFDLCVARTFQGPIITDMGQETWLKAERELLRVADSLCLLNITEPEVFQLVDKSCNSQQACRLVYKTGPDGGSIEKLE